MKFITDEQPPSSLEPEVREYLYRLFGEVSIALSSTDTLTKRRVKPERPETGRIYYFSNAIAGDPVIDEEGFYGYTSTNYVKLHN
jgi:hypothetical protein